MRRRYYLKMKLGEENKKNILLYKQTKNDKYKEKIILDNRKLSLVIFNKYKEMYKVNSCISLQDLKEELIQEGDLALSIAIDEFDANKGIEFSTYAYTVIENAFYHYFSKNKNLIRLPKKTEILISKVKNAIIKLKEFLIRGFFKFLPLWTIDNFPIWLLSFLSTKSGNLFFSNGEKSYKGPICAKLRSTSSLQCFSGEISLILFINNSK